MKADQDSLEGMRFIILRFDSVSFTLSNVVTLFAFVFFFGLGRTLSAFDTLLSKRCCLWNCVIAALGSGQLNVSSEHFVYIRKSAYFSRKTMI